MCVSVRLLTLPGCGGWWGGVNVEWAGGGAWVVASLLRHVRCCGCVCASPTDEAKIIGFKAALKKGCSVKFYKLS